MKKKILTVLFVAGVVMGSLVGCNSAETAGNELVQMGTQDTTVQSGQENAVDEEAKKAEEEAKKAEEEAKKAEEEAKKAEEEAKKAEEAAKEQERKANEAYENGRAYLYGLNDKAIDLAAAHACFEEALELGNVNANFYLGVLYDFYAYPEQDYEKAKAYYDLVSENPLAMVSVGFQYYYGKGVEENREKSKELWQNAVDAGCSDANYGFAVISEGSDELGKVFELLNTVIESGTEPLYQAMAMSELGAMYFSGVYVEQDYTLAKEWFGKAAAYGDEDSALILGTMYYRGIGGEQDYEKAKEWFEMAANFGNSTAMYNLGYFYAFDSDFGIDYTKAMEWYQKAGAQNDSAAFCDMGYLYEAGLGVEQNYTKAMENYQKAADLGNSNAMNNIGLLYCMGYGVEEDLNKAMEWFEKAVEADPNNLNAKESLENVKDYLGM